MAPMTPAKYRKLHAAEIEEYKRKGIEVDVCHIISKSNSGADDSDNYILASAEFNKSIGNQWDELMIYMAYQIGGIERVRSAIRVSPGSGYKVYDAERLVEKGRQEWNKRHLSFNKIAGQRQGVSQIEGARICELEYAQWVVRIWNSAVART